MRSHVRRPLSRERKRKDDPNACVRQNRCLIFYGRYKTRLPRGLSNQAMEVTCLNKNATSILSGPSVSSFYDHFDSPTPSSRHSGDRSRLSRELSQKYLRSSAGRGDFSSKQFILRVAMTANFCLDDNFFASCAQKKSRCN